MKYRNSRISEGKHLLNKQVMEEPIVIVSKFFEDKVLEEVLTNSSETCYYVCLCHKRNIC